MNRWIRLIATVVAMATISNLQYCWTLFVKPITSATHWRMSDVQYGFSIFIAVVTWGMPLAGWLIDRLGPRLFISIAGVLCAIGWGSLGHATSLTEFYLFYSVAGLGVSFVYCSSIGAALKWFPDKRGLASGIIAGAYGSGAALSILIFKNLIKTSGYSATFFSTAIVMGAVILIAGQFMAYPPADFAKTLTIPVKARVRKQGSEDFNSRNAAQAAFLSDVRNDADGRHRRSDDQRTDRAGGKYLQDRLACVGLGPYSRSHR